MSKRFLLRYRQEIIVIIVALFNRFITLVLGLILVTNSLGVRVSDLDQAFVHWDGEWYLQIIENGYDNNFASFDSDHWYCNTGEGNCQRNFAFFPLYPFLVASISTVFNIDYVLSGVFLSNTSFVIAALLLFKLTRQLVNIRVAWYSLALLMVFPTSYLFSAFMSESLYLMLFLAAVYFALHKRWFLSSIMGMMLSATRNTGIMIIPVLFLIYFEEKYKDKKFPGWNLFKQLDFKIVILILSSALGLIAFMIYLNQQVGDPLAFINIQRYWEKPVNGVSPLLAIPYSFLNWQLETSLKIHIYNLAFFFMLAALGIWGYIKRKLPLSQIFILIIVFIPLLSGSMLALPRYISVLYPIYILGAILISRSRRWGGLVLLLSSIFSFIMLNAYVHGLWITV